MDPHRKGMWDEFGYFLGGQGVVSNRTVSLKFSIAVMGSMGSSYCCSRVADELLNMNHCSSSSFSFLVKWGRSS